MTCAANSCNSDGTSPCTFAPLTRGESLEESIVRHQRLMIEKLELREGMVVADVGCGVGGPMRRVARESGARVVCINNNEQQLEKARRRNVETGSMIWQSTSNALHGHECDRTRLFDAGYAIESTCYAPDKVRAFAEIFRILKPGALLWVRRCACRKVQSRSLPSPDYQRRTHAWNCSEGDCHVLGGGSRD